MSRVASSSRADASRPDPGVVALDRLSERLLGAVPGLRVDVARSAAELAEAYRLRYEQVVGHGWAGRDALPDGAERDAHDDAAVHVAAWDAGELVGTVRLVLPAPGRLLPVEEAFGIEIEPRGAVVEVGRLVIVESRRGDEAHRAWGALFARAWLATRERGFTLLGGAASPGLVERLRAVGLPFEILGPAVPYWGQLRHPVRLDPAGSRPGWFGPTA